MEGLIRKVFQNRRKDFHEQEHRDLDRLEQELVAEITKNFDLIREFDFIGHNNSKIMKTGIKILLLGSDPAQ